MFDRHPEPDGRPSICDISMSLQKPDFKLLQWNKDEDLDEDSKTLGAPLEKGHQLYLDLQKIYISDKDSSSDKTEFMDESALKKFQEVQDVEKKPNDNGHYYHTLVNPELVKL